MTENEDNSKDETIKNSEKQDSKTLERFEQLEKSIKQKNDNLIAGKYRLDKVIGQGGMGKIYLATHLKLKRTVAIKLMLVPEDDEATKRFEEEAAVTASLSHPNTIRIFDFGVMEDDVLYLVMEYLDGISIKQYLKKNGAFSSILAAKLVSDVCGALMEAHDKGIVHRDIKPGNIMLVRMTEGGVRAKLLDFGLVKSLNASRIKTRTGLILGSPMYMSPEQVNSKGLAPASDLYSLGLTLHNMLTNTRPFPEKSLSSLLAAQLLKYPTPLEDLRPELAKYPRLIHIVNKAIQKDPKLRFQSAEQMKEALENFLGKPETALEPQKERLFQKKDHSEQDSSSQFLTTKSNSIDNATFEVDLNASIQESSLISERSSISKDFMWMITLGILIIIGIGMVFLSSFDKEEEQAVKMVSVQTEEQEKINSKAEVIESPKENSRSKPEQRKEIPKNKEVKEAITQQTGDLSIDILSGEKRVLGVDIICASINRSKKREGSKIEFTDLPKGVCELKFNLIGAVYSKVKDVVVGSHLLCSEKNGYISCQEKN